jgi:hypothetical protein
MLNRGMFSTEASVIMNVRTNKGDDDETWSKVSVLEAVCLIFIDSLLRITTYKEEKPKY